MDLDNHAGSRWTPGFKALFGVAGNRDLPLDEGGLPAGIHPDDRALAHARVWTATDPAGPGTLHVELRAVALDGSVRRLLLLGQVFREDNGCWRLSGMGLDMGAHLHVQEAHARLLREQAILADFSLRARDATDVQTICEVAATVLVRSMDVALSKLLELLPNGETFLFRAAAGWRQHLAGATRIPTDPRTPAGLALKLREPVILNDVHFDPRFDLPGYMRESAVANSMAVVIPAGNPPFGVLEVDSTAGHPFTEGDLQFLQSVANVLAATIVRIHSEERWRQEDAFTTVALNASSTLVTVVDAEGRLVRFSPACERLSGYTAEEALGRPAEEFVLPEERDEIRSAIAGLNHDTDRMVHAHENHWLTRSGERRLITWSATILRDRAGEVQYVVGTGLDITERKRLERDILAIAERERRRIGNDLHDDLGQRLAAIQFLSGDLQQDLAGAPPALAQLASRIAVMAREANAHARMLARGLSPTALDAVGLVEALRALARNTTALFRVACECQAEGDHDTLAPEAAIHLYRIAQEAVSNAVTHAQAKQIVIEVFPQGRCELRVSDDGIGFNPEKVRGEGIGLQSMQYRASLFRGRVHVHSQPGQGTQLVCEFSPTWFRPDRAKQLNTFNMASNPDKKRILIVDDHPMMREGIAHSIGREPDLEVCGEVGTVAQAIAIVETHEPDLVLADISLPGRDGVELIKDLRATHPAMAVLVVSSHDESIFAERVLRAGGRGYVTKQEGSQEMVRAIRRVLGGQIFLSEKLSGNLLQQFYMGSASGERSVVNQLSDREFEVFQLIGRGFSTQTISEQLHLSTKTVDAHRANIKEKLGLQTTAELISYAATWRAQTL